MSAKGLSLWLAPLRGVTIRTFREVFTGPLHEAGFVGAFAPFIPANPGIRVTDALLKDLDGSGADTFPLVPQVIGKHPDALRVLLRALKARGFRRADLNAGCPFPMIVRKNRGSGLLRTPDVLESLLAAGVEEMGPGNFSLKVRLGVAAPDELLKLMPMINQYPLAVLTVHARTAKQMYTGTVDLDAFAAVAAVSSNPIMYNGDLAGPTDTCVRGLRSGGKGPAVLTPDMVNARIPSVTRMMVGRGFVRAMGAREDARDLLSAYIDRSCAELAGDVPVLGRMKELLSYWCALPAWQRLWPLVKICRSIDELRQVACYRGSGWL